MSATPSYDYATRMTSTGDASVTLFTTQSDGKVSILGVVAISFPTHPHHRYIAVELFRRHPTPEAFETFKQATDYAQRVLAYLIPRGLHAAT